MFCGSLKALLTGMFLEQRPVYQDDLIFRFLFRRSYISLLNLRVAYFCRFFGELGHQLAGPDVEQLSVRVIGNVRQRGRGTHSSFILPFFLYLILQTDTPPSSSSRSSSIYESSLYNYSPPTSPTPHMDIQDMSMNIEEGEEETMVNDSDFEPISSSAHHPILVNIYELSLLRHLAWGVGVSQQEWNELGMPCRLCGLLYVARMLRPHNNVCASCREA